MAVSLATEDTKPMAEALALGPTQPRGKSLANRTTSPVEQSLAPNVPSPVEYPFAAAYSKPKIASLREEPMNTVPQIWSRYIGPVPRLKGKTALVMEVASNRNIVVAQFDEVGLTHDGENLSYGWHDFPREHFEPISPPPPPPPDAA